jgi:hypothetical protein
VRTFSDAHGQQWEIAGNLATFERVKTATGVDMLTLPTTQECLKQVADPYTLGRVLYEVCAGQCEKRGISPEEFAGGLTADTLADATDTLIQEAIFFCRSALRPALTMAHEKAKARDRQAMESLAAKLPTIGRMMDAALDRMEIPTGSATSSPEFSASIPLPGRSDTSSGRPKGRRKNGGLGRAS